MIQKTLRDVEKKNQCEIKLNRLRKVRIKGASVHHIIRLREYKFARFNELND